MGTRLHIGRSIRADAEGAACEAARAALESAEQPVMALVFACAGYDPDKLAAALSEEFATLPWAGLTAAGVFCGVELMREGLVVGVLSSESAYVGVGVAGPVTQNARSAGAAAVDRALDQLPSMSPGRSRALLLMLSAVTGQAGEIVRGAVREGGMAAGWAGGGAGDNLRSMRTAQFARGAAFRDHVVAAALDLPGRIGVGMRHGWSAYGPPTLVTNARGARVLELEYEPAFEIYRRTAQAKGEEVTAERFAHFAATHPLGIPEANGEYVIRDPLAVEENGALRFIGEVADGTLLRMMHATPEELLAAARDAGAAARAGLGELGGALVFDCSSRSDVLGDRFVEELRAIQDGLGAPVPVMGCLTFGEVGSLGSEVAQFHNKTVVVLALPA